jgi:hypothetical protein
VEVNTAYRLSAVDLILGALSTSTTYKLCSAQFDAGSDNCGAQLTIL